MILSNKIKEVFGVDVATSGKMDIAINDGINAYKNNPYWIDEENGVKTINFAKSLCSETARLSMLGIKITVDGSGKAAWIQEQIDKVFYKIREWVEYGCAYGTIVLKPSDEGIDFFTPEDFAVTESKNGIITGIVFVYRKKDGDKYYTRLEYHHYINNFVQL